MDERQKWLSKIEALLGLGIVGRSVGWVELRPGLRGGRTSQATGIDRMSGDAVETFEVLRTPYGRWVWCPAAGTLTYAKKGRQPDWATPQIRLDAAHNSQGCAVAAAVREHADPHWWAVNIASHS